MLSGLGVAWALLFLAGWHFAAQFWVDEGGSDRAEYSVNYLHPDPISELRRAGNDLENAEMRF